MPGAFISSPEGVEGGVAESETEADGFSLERGEVGGIVPAEFVAEVVGGEGCAFGGGVSGDGLRLFVEEFGAEFAVVGVGVEVERAVSETERARDHGSLVS